jgi:hypothetical protein
MDNQKDLYQISLKMIKDKYHIHSFSIDTFNSIYQQFYHNDIQPNNNINKQILKNIDELVKNQLSSSSVPKEEKTITTDIINEKLLEVRNMRASMITNSNGNIKTNINNTESQFKGDTAYYEGYNIYNHFNNNNNNNNNNNGKSFIINCIKNTIYINNKINNIYPAYLCIPSIIKNNTPYIILSINDEISYTFIPMVINDVWDIWKPVNDNYVGINSKSVLNISICDFTNCLIDFSDFYSEILEIGETGKGYHIKTNGIFQIKDKIKIITKTNHQFDSQIIHMNNNIITIKKNNIKKDDFMNSKIFNCKYQFSLIFKYSF